MRTAPFAGARRASCSAEYAGTQAGGPDVAAGDVAITFVPPHPTQKAVKKAPSHGIDEGRAIRRIFVET